MSYKERSKSWLLNGPSGFFLKSSVMLNTRNSYFDSPIGINQFNWGVYHIDIHQRKDETDYAYST